MMEKAIENMSKESRLSGGNGVEACIMRAVRTRLSNLNADPSHNTTKSL